MSRNSFKRGGRERCMLSIFSTGCMSTVAKIVCKGHKKELRNNAF
jgi:hypothetical protein